MLGDEEHRPTQLDRRELLRTVGFWSVSGAAAALLGAPGIRFVVGKSLDPGEERWVETGPVGEVSQDTFRAVQYQFRSKDAWREVERRGLVYVRAREDGTILALSAQCTHLGCLVVWRQSENQFACPCHTGFYDATGNVISGPPPRPLAQLETKVENGKVLVRV